MFATWPPLPVGGLRNQTEPRCHGRHFYEVLFVARWRQSRFEKGS